MTDPSAGDPSAGSAVEPGGEPRPPDAEIDDRPGHDHRIDPDVAPDDTAGSWRELSTDRRPAGDPAQGMLPARRQRGTSIERGSMRVLATGGIVGLATIL